MSNKWDENESKNSTMVFLAKHWWFHDAHTEEHFYPVSPTVLANGNDPSIDLIGLWCPSFPEAPLTDTDWVTRANTDWAHVEV